MPFDFHWRHIKVLNKACRRDACLRDGKALYMPQKKKVEGRGKFTPQAKEKEKKERKTRYIFNHVKEATQSTSKIYSN